MAGICLSMSYASLGLHFVVVRHGISRELWVTAGPRKEAVANVLWHFSAGHIAELSDRRITAEEAVHLEHLKMVRLASTTTPRLIVA